MFDIYSVAPNAIGTLNHVLVAGNYQKWGDVVLAIRHLNKIVFAKNPLVVPIFEVQPCTHRKTSNQYKTMVSHTAPTSFEDISLLF